MKGLDAIRPAKKSYLSFVDAEFLRKYEPETTGRDHGAVSCWPLLFRRQFGSPLVILCH